MEITDSKKELANQIKMLVSDLRERIEDARQMGLEVEMHVSKLAPAEPISVTIFERSIF